MKNVQKKSRVLSFNDLKIEDYPLVKPTNQWEIVSFTNKPMGNCFSEKKTIMKTQ